MAVRLFVGNLSYSTTEADLRTYFGAIAPPIAGRSAGRSRDRTSPRVCVRRIPGSRARRAGDSAVQRTGVQRPSARGQRGARARRSRPGRPALAGPAARRRFGSAPPSSFGGPPRPFDPNAAPARGPRSRNFGPDAKPQRGGSAKAKKKESERPRGPIPLKNTGRSFTLDDADTDADDASLADRRRFRHEQAERGT